MSNWSKSLLIGLAAALVVFFSYEYIFLKKIKRSYSVHYVTEIVPGTHQPGMLQEDMLSRMPGAIRRRLENLGYQPAIKMIGDGTFDIRVSDAEDTNLLRQVITSNSKLEFREVYTLLEIQSAFMAIQNKVKDILSPGKAEDTLTGHQLPKLLSEEPISLFTLIAFTVETSATREYTRPEIGEVNENDTSVLNQLLHHAEIKPAFPADLRFCYGAVGSPNMFYLYAIRTYMQEAELKNDDIKNAEAQAGYGGMPEIFFQFKDIGARRWERMTTKNVGKHIAIVLDDRVISAPRVNEPITGGQSTLSGGFTFEEAKLLALQLKAGMLPARLSIIKEEVLTVADRRGTITAIIISLIAFALATAASFFIFNMLKNS